jgi:hypothetical protein
LEEHTASILNVNEEVMQEAGASCMAYTLILKIDAVHSSETSQFFWFTLHYILEDTTVHSHFVKPWI